MANDSAQRMAARARRSAVSAGAPIPEAKITAPRVPEWAVQRPRITELIAEGTRWCPLTVVTGPPGAGKTVALALWAAAAPPGPVAWISLDEYDNRPGVFWSSVVAAMRRSGVAVPGTSSAAARGRAADHVFLLRLASSLASHEPPVTLVVDDLHVLTEPPLLTGLDFLLRNVGSGLRLVVSSRMDPPLPLHRYRLAGGLAEIRAGDLAFSVAEAGLLMGQYSTTLSAGSLERLTRRTEGWAAGLRLAAISMDTHPDPDQFVKELIAEDSALTSYLVDEVLNTQPPEARDVLLSTSILDQVSAEAIGELVGNEQASRILPDLARTNAFVQPTGTGKYRYHPLFAEVLRLKLRRECPDRLAALHRRAARWYERNGPLTEAVRHAISAGDWQLAADLVIDALAISEIIEPRGSLLASEFSGMPLGGSWTGPQPHLVFAAAELAAGRQESCAAALATAERILECLPADQEAAGRLAATTIRVAVSLRTGEDLTAAAAAAARAEALVSRIPGDKLAQHPEIRARVLVGRGAVGLWSGHLDEAARILDTGAAAAAAAGADYEQADCLGRLALTEALRGRLRRAAKLAAQSTAAPVADKQPPPAQPAALLALAWVHLERNDLREAHRLLKQVDAALRVSPDMLIGAVAWLAVARGGLAEGRPSAATQAVATARSWPCVPAWLERRLSLAESWAHVETGDIRAAVAAAGKAGGGGSLEAAVTIAGAWAAAGESQNAAHALAPVLAARSGVTERVRLQAWLVDARLSYGSDDPARGRRSLVSALRLAEREQIRLPFVMERGWLGPVLRRDPQLADTYQRLLAPAPSRYQLPVPPGAPDEAKIAVVEPLTKREREVLRHVSLMMNTAEVASEMYLSINTVKSHLKSIYRKLAAAHRGEAVRRARQLELI
jgi:LuxR family transcriptional regulator, maltose regulon positive regulatory protein